MIKEESPTISRGWRYSQLKWGLQMYKTGYTNTNLIGKCGSCKHYKPLIKKDSRMGFEVEYCRGRCNIAKKCSYRQRTDKCKQYEGVKV